MSSLIPTFLSNIEYLELNQVPKTNAGKPFAKLRYKGEKYEKLTDADVKSLCNALKKNTCFSGCIVLSNNGLTDLSGLYIADAMKTFGGIRRLSLSNNNLKSKSGEYIGDELINNPEYNMIELDFKGNRLEEYGLRRMIYAATTNNHLKVLNIGIISDFGLDLISQELINLKLTRLTFQEDETKPFSEKAKEQFVKALKSCIENYEDFNVQKIKANLISEDERIEQYCAERKNQIKEFKKFKLRNKALAQKLLVKNVIKHIEGKKSADKVAVK